MGSVLYGRLVGPVGPHGTHVPWTSEEKRGEVGVHMGNLWANRNATTEKATVEGILTGQTTARRKQPHSVTARWWCRPHRSPWVNLQEIDDEVYLFSYLVSIFLFIYLFICSFSTVFVTKRSLVLWMLVRNETIRNDFVLTHGALSLPFLWVDLPILNLIWLKPTHFLIFWEQMIFKFNLRRVYFRCKMFLIIKIFSSKC